MSSKLSIVTVVFNNLDGLKRTISSIEHILDADIEYWVIDGGSTDGTQEFLNGKEQEWIHWISEPDDGLYDAMNKGLEKVSGDFVLFINSADLIDQHFSWNNFINYAGTHITKVLIGQTIEVYGSNRYLRPRKEREDLAFQAPPHQATFYPRIFFNRKI